MRNVILLATLLFFFSLILSGCVQTTSYVIDKNLLETNHIFKSSQEPKFSMRIPEGLVYQKTSDHSESDTDGSWTTKVHTFVDKQQDYIIIVNMATVHMAEWGMGYPWSEHLGKEIHGSKPFYCGTGVYPDNASKTSQEVKYTFKGWNYTPGGIGTPGSTRISIFYLEKGDLTNGMDVFLARADTRVDFTME